MNQQLQNNDNTATLEQIEDRVFGKIQSFMQRLEEISYVPVTIEADILAVKAAMDQLSADMQTFSNSLILEGPRSGNLPGTVLGIAVPALEGAEAAAA